MGTRLSCAAGTATSRRYIIENITPDEQHLERYAVPDTWDELVRYVLTGAR